MNTQLGNQKGAILIIFAIAIIPMLAIVGAVIDLNRVSIVEARAQSALDKAGLAAIQNNKALTVKTLSNYFYTNYKEEAFGGGKHFGKEVKFSFKYDADDNLILNFEAEVQNMFLPIIGIQTSKIAVESRVTKSNIGVELVLALDNTNSMDDDNKMTILKKVSKDFVNLLFNGKDFNPKVKVGLVPFADSINIGKYGLDFPHKWVNKGRSNYGYTGVVWKQRSNGETVDMTPGKWDNRIAEDCVDFFGDPDCTKAQVLPLTNNRIKVINRLNDMESRGGTMINMGASWGWKVLSSKLPYPQGSVYGNQDWKKFMILLTDGENVKENHPSYHFRYSWEDFDKNLLKVCTKMKDKDITIFTIGFGILGGSPAHKMMKSCATKDSYYFDARSKTNLEDAFNEIKKKITNTKIYK